MKDNSIDLLNKAKALDYIHEMENELQVVKDFINEKGVSQKHISTIRKDIRNIHLIGNTFIIDFLEEIYE